MPPPFPSLWRLAVVLVALAAVPVIRCAIRKASVPAPAQDAPRLSPVAQLTRLADAVLAPLSTNAGALRLELNACAAELRRQSASTALVEACRAVAQANEKRAEFEALIQEHKTFSFGNRGSSEKTREFYLANDARIWGEYVAQQRPVIQALLANAIDGAAAESEAPPPRP